MNFPACRQGPLSKVSILIACSAMIQTAVPFIACKGFLPVPIFWIPMLGITSILSLQFIYF